MDKWVDESTLSKKETKAVKTASKLCTTAIEGAAVEGERESAEGLHIEIISVRFVAGIHMFPC
jgi:hypothetical protein